MPSYNTQTKQKLTKQAFEKIQHIESLLTSVDVQLAKQHKKAA